jgi:hypothetical protein
VSLENRDGMVPLAAGWRVAFSDNADAGGAIPASPAALPYAAGGTGVHTGFKTTRLIRTRIIFSVAPFAQSRSQTVSAVVMHHRQMWLIGAQADSLPAPEIPTGARGADTTLFPPERVTNPYPQHRISRFLGVNVPAVLADSEAAHP